MEYSNEKLHEVLIEILDFAKKVCDENNLTYFLVYGTALGARRHSGFIPWDDDVDIALPREDYERFIEILSKSDCSDYSIQNEINEKNYFLTFSKIRKKGTVFIEDLVDVDYLDNGIYIDIFPLDYIKNPKSISFKIKRFIFDYIKHILRFSNSKKSYRQKYGKIRFFGESILSIPALLLSNRFLLDFSKKLVISTDEAMFVGQLEQKSEEGIMPFDYYFPPALAKFGDKMYNVPGRLDDYLRHQYGENYMELPPIEQRQTHQPIVLKF